MSRERLAFLPAALAFGFVFLYLPILLLIVFSFNESRLVSVWAGFSTRWYGELLRNERMLEAAALSLGVAATAATLAGVAGTLAGYALGRLGAFALRPLFALLLLAPMILPEVILGLSMLMSFAALERAIGWPETRGFIVVALAHATYGTAFVALIVEARLRGLDPALEEAALDLGATPARAFLRVSVPLLAPAIASGWLLAFTLSLDDLVIASFVAGPGATTLPMLVYSSVRLGLSPQINALATILVLGIAVLAFVSMRIDARVRKLST
ncbi:MAG: ABC transporter permease subunit [Tagaea sp.]|nr:ABC transporter permease subunit [Tagaea sp.]